MTRALSIAVSVAFVLASALLLSCNVNDYCLNCATGDGDGGLGDGGDGDGGGDGGDGDAGDGGMCVPSGIEKCDNKDNDCDNNIDELPLPADPFVGNVGDPCVEQQGECAGCTYECVAGAVVKSKPPVPEVCDNLDNNCNGINDDGDPGGGASCGTDVGECIAGTNRCQGGQVVCVGAVGTVGGVPEACNGRDDDCDASLDEGLGNLGSCGMTDVGECALGTLMCMGGGTVCVGDVGPTFEVCDNLDQDCDGNPTNGFNLMTDVQNCGMCGNVCNLPNAFEGCAGGMCTIASCQPNFHNNDGNVGTGCEFGPCSITGNETCNGLDDDCDGTADDNITPPPVGTFCRTQGECAGATVTCNGTMGFRCNYPDPDVSDDANGNVLPENRCDGLDNDCDGAIDEGQPNLGDACSDAGVGACRGTGTFQCNTGNPTGPAVCVITMPGGTSMPESCDNVDNDCDGPVDEGVLLGQDWVSIGGGREMMRYEASKPDATATAVGSVTAKVCSRAGVQPWTNVTYPQAVAACTTAGARLCQEGEWHRTCSVVSAPTFPIAVPGGMFSTTFEAEDYFSIAFANDTAPNPDVVHSWTPDYTPGFFRISALEASPNSGSNVSTGNAVLNSPRVSYQLNVAAAGSYRVCIRAFSVTSNDNTVHVGIGNTEAAAPTQTIQTPANNAWRWSGPSAAIAVTAGTRFINVFMAEDGMRIDQIHLTTQNACPADSNPPAGSAGNRWAYQNTPNTYQPTVCNGEDLDADLPPATPGDQDDILATGGLAMCHANNGANDVFDMSGNVKEWTLARQPGQNPLRGGASNNTANGISCPLNFTLADDQFFFPNVGFRCCR